MAEQVASLLDSLADQLLRLRIGDRCWYWMCPTTSGLTPPLLLQPLRNDPTMTRLVSLASRQPVPDNAPRSMGLVSVDPTGRLSFGGPNLSAEMLGALAAWTLDLAPTYPELARLRDAVLLEIRDGAVVARHQDPSLWEGLTPPPVKGSIAETDERLRLITPGQDAWFWMTDRGPGDQPHLAVGNPHRDPDGKRFAKQVALLLRQSPTAGAAVQGVARQTTGGLLVLTTPRPLAQTTPIVHALLRAHAPRLAPLRGARLVQIRDGKVIASQKLSSPLDGIAEALESLPVGGILRFWFTHAGQDGQPLLLLNNDRNALKTAAQSARGAGSELRGHVEKTLRGWLHFQTRQPDETFLPALARWAKHHAPTEPALRRLSGARVTVRDRDGTIVTRYKKDTLWEGLSS